MGSSENSVSLDEEPPDSLSIVSGRYRHSVPYVREDGLREIIFYDSYVSRDEESFDLVVDELFPCMGKVKKRRFIDLRDLPVSENIYEVLETVNEELGKPRWFRKPKIPQIGAGDLAKLLGN